MASDVPMWAFLVAALDVAGWLVVCIAGGDWLFAENPYFVLHVSLLGAQMDRGTKMVRKHLWFKGTKEFSGQRLWLEDLAGKCELHFQNQWCNNLTSAWMAGTLMAVCIFFACLLMLVGCIFLYKYGDKPTRNGWVATVVLLSAAPLLLSGGWLLYSMLTLTFGKDDLAMAGLSSYGIGYIMGLALTLFSVCPICLVTLAMERKKDEEDMGHIHKREQQYGAASSGTLVVGPVGMVQQPVQVSAVTVTTNEYVGPQALPVQPMAPAF